MHLKKGPRLIEEPIPIDVKPTAYLKKNAISIYLAALDGHSAQFSLIISVDKEGVNRSQKQMVMKSAIPITL